MYCVAGQGSGCSSSGRCGSMSFVQVELGGFETLTSSDRVPVDPVLVVYLLY